MYLLWSCSLYYMNVLVFLKCRCSKGLHQCRVDQCGSQEMLNVFMLVNGQLPWGRQSHGNQRQSPADKLFCDPRSPQCGKNNSVLTRLQAQNLNIVYIKRVCYYRQLCASQAVNVLPNIEYTVWFHTHIHGFPMPPSDSRNMRTYTPPSVLMKPLWRY
jgi:hypothetical protein